MARGQTAERKRLKKNAESDISRASVYWKERRAERHQRTAADPEAA